MRSFTGLPYYAITDGRWKYIFYSEGGAEQLFDLENDPQELIDLAREPRFEPKRLELQREMVRRHAARGSQAIEGDRLVVHPVLEDPKADRRNRFWPGYHTEYYDHDVRH